MPTLKPLLQWFFLSLVGLLDYRVITLDGAIALFSELSSYSLVSTHPEMNGGPSPAIRALALAIFLFRLLFFGGRGCHGMHTEVRGQPVGVGSLFLPVGPGD